MYLDDVSVIGSIPMVNMNNNKLYVVERTPQTVNFAGTGAAASGITTISARALIQMKRAVT